MPVKILLLVLSALTLGGCCPGELGEPPDGGTDADAETDGPLDCPPLPSQCVSAPADCPDPCAGTALQYAELCEPAVTWCRLTAEACGCHRVYCCALPAVAP